MLIKHSIIAIALALSGLSLSRAEEKPPLPSGPLIKRMGGYASWKIIFSYGHDKLKPGEQEVGYPDNPTNEYLPSLPRTITVTRTHPLWRATTVDLRGNVLEQCGDGGDEYLESPNHGASLIPAENGNGRTRSLMDFNRYDCPDLEWISPSTYAGMKEMGGNRCMVFVKNGMVALVNLETRLPVLWQNGAETRVFQQLPPPASKLTLPPSIARLAEALKKDREALRRPLPPGS